MKRIKFIKLWLLTVLIFSVSLNANAVTRISAHSGNWNDAGTWNPTGIPACGDSVVILAVHTINISNQQNYETCATPFRLIVYGRLLFFNGSKLSLSCGSYVIVYPGGVIDHDQGFSSSNLINICNIVEWNSNSTLNGLACLPGTHPICSQVLAAELIDFSVQQTGMNKVSLKWETASESFTDYFSIQRSVDGFDWMEISQQDAAGFSSALLEYEAFDDNPAEGISYYRLCIHDQDGKINFSDVKMININLQSGNEIVIAPNPANESFSAIIKSYTEEYIRFELYDLSGRLLMTEEFNGNSGSYFISGINEKASGITMLKVFDKENNLRAASLLVIE